MVSSIHSLSLHIRRRHRALMVSAIAALLGAGSSSATWARDEMAMNCQIMDGAAGAGWQPVEPLTSATLPGAVLFRSSTPITVKYGVRPAPSLVPHELILAASWLGVGYPWTMDPAAVPTDVEGIRYRVILDARDGAARAVPLSESPVALDRRVTDPAIDSTAMNFIQELVLAVPPNQLPSGEQTVTRVAGSATLQIYAIDMLKGLISSLGNDRINVGSLPTTPTGICRKRLALSGMEALNLGGGGGVVPIPNKCLVEAYKTVRVPLGKYGVQDFPSVNSTSPARSFAISLSQCAAAAKPEITFTDKYKSVASQADPTVLNLAPGGARGLGIIMLKGQTEVYASTGGAGRGQSTHDAALAWHSGQM
ncbi:fimbrial protein CupB6 [Cupriavidus basilensis OR16]|uniref:Fimbrial protein CupB6 n=2 Tax=Cupriavidus basilensis TaxID=68895 RepID=H1S7J1_9BURK|nr:fimbrial protein CupB6 [Cupriavidus basilensis OR16]